jgi:glucose dehydrogenase
MMWKIHPPLKGLLRSIILALAIALALFVGLLPVNRISTADGIDKAMQTDWPTFGNDPGGQRYAPLTQINAVMSRNSCARGRIT